MFYLLLWNNYVVFTSYLLRIIILHSSPYTVTPYYLRNGDSEPLVQPVLTLLLSVKVCVMITDGSA